MPDIAALPCSFSVAGYRHTLPEGVPAASPPEHGRTITQVNLRAILSRARLSPAAQAACLQVYASWLKHVSPAEALQQAMNFAHRCSSLVEHQVISKAELDRVIDVVAVAMAAP